MLEWSSRTWWLVLGIFAIVSIISIFTFAAQCLGCCPSQQHHVHTPANWELRQYGMLHFPVPPGGPAIIQISGMQPQPAPPPPQGRQARKQKVQPLTAELLNRLPSFFLASTSKNDSLEDRECAICQEDMAQTKVLSLPCGHLFHKECVKEWLQRKATCPTCRLLLDEGVLGGRRRDVEEGGGSASESTNATSTGSAGPHSAERRASIASASPAPGAAEGIPRQQR
ncbi:probable ERAD-associated E3 ubiquitin-protein ligase HRD1B [Coccomyxa sp. Obi]|nr:probable ERAD-associated E3 ubiquitin-protein ligase HRD1B [Coccomyxa sp. Obi]